MSNNTAKQSPNLVLNARAIDTVTWLREEYDPLAEWAPEICEDSQDIFIARVFTAVDALKARIEKEGLVPELTRRLQGVHLAVCGSEGIQVRLVQAVQLVDRYLDSSEEKGDTWLFTQVAKELGAHELKLKWFAEWEEWRAQSRKTIRGRRIVAWIRKRIELTGPADSQKFRDAVENEQANIDKAFKALATVE